MKKPLHTLLALAAILTAGLFAGCATSGDRETPAVTRADVITALEITAALAMGDEPELALQYVRDARQYIGDGERATLDEVIDHLLTRAIHSKLEPAQAIAVKRFVDRYREHLALEIDKVGLDSQILVTVHEVLDAVEGVALEVQRYGAAQPRTYTAARESIPPMRQRQDLLGYLFGWTEPNPAYVEKWGPGMGKAIILSEE